MTEKVFIEKVINEQLLFGLFYGSLIPEGSGNNTPELSKADILIHLNALTDGIRLATTMPVLNPRNNNMTRSTTTTL